MVGYWIVHATESSDPETAATYGKLWKPIAEKYQARILASAGAHQTVEGEDHPRNLIVEFPSYQAALDCYHDPDYTAAAAYALQAYSRELVIVEGN